MSRAPVRRGLLAVALLAAPVPWGLQVSDTRGVRVDADRLRGHVTLVVLSTRDTRPRAMAIGQEGGGRFGARPGFLSLSIANTSQLPFVLRPFAARGVGDAEKEAVELALARQHAQGNASVTEDDVRRHIVFVHDGDGRVWRALGVDPVAGGLHVGVIDAGAQLVYLAHEPTDPAEVFTVMENELGKLERR